MIGTRSMKDFAMTDDLRTRIAAALGEHGELGNDCRCGWQWLGYNFAPTTHTAYDEHLADVLIRELGLPPTWGKPSFENGTTDQVDTPIRYVTECTENG